MSTLQVDKITPYLSASVTIEGSVIQANAATTGSNTFVGDQNIQGTLTASLQEGYAWVGGVGNVSILAATSSFGGGGSGFPFEGDAVITGSLTISGSSLFDLTVDGRQVITGPTTGVGAPQLAVSSSDVNALLSRTSLSFRNPAGNGFSTDLSKQGLAAYTEPGLGAELLLGNFDAGFTTDVEFLAKVTETGIVFQDYQNGGGFAFDTFMSIAPNLGDNPDVRFLRSLQVTGSVDISSVLELKGLDPLPAGGVGQLAVSSSGDLYYHNGAGWQLK